MISSEPIAPLRPANVRDLRLSWLSSFDARALTAHLTHTDVPSFWVPGTGEYAIAGWWRGRADVGCVIELHGRGNKERLLQALCGAARERGARAMVVSANEAWKDGKWYLQHGFVELDRIVLFLLHPLRVPTAPATSLTILPYHDVDLAAVTTVDRASFSWLWWNDPDDFRRYTEGLNVHVWTGWSKGELVAYASATIRPGRGHLDRLAVRRASQGLGFGRTMLARALHDMALLGAKECGLTTQAVNRVAQRLYESVGFRKLDEYEPIIGQWLGPPVVDA
ncbi:MAG: GNAT family N-acetyltransferase [Dehalococcoidia bacterium]|nr:GNAT family N-acetyltransferase [Dehalococcoidia bacterium]